MDVKTPLAAAVLAAVLVAGACSSSEGAVGGPAADVVATTSIWADITSRVACGDPVDSVIPAGTDTHDFEPSVRDADRVESARVIVANGLGLEEGLGRLLESAESRGATVVEVGPDASPLDDDPHVWMDPDRVAAVVPLIAEALDADPQCAADYVEELHELSTDMEDLLDAVPSGRRALVTNHETLGYFADRFGFEVVGAVVPSTSSLAETNPRDLDLLAETMRERGIDTVFADVTGSSALAESLTARIGRDAAVVELHTESLVPGGDGPDTYLDMMRENARAVAGALAPAG